MRNNKGVFLSVFACLLLAHCATSKAPTHWLNDPEAISKDVYGAWVDVKARQGSLSGELIAIQPDSVYVADQGLHSVAVADVLEMRVTLYDSGSALGWGTAGGTLLALSNGLIFVGSGPMWIVGGTIAAIARTYDPVYSYPSYDLKALAKFARFPQGLPLSLDRKSIKAKVPK